NLMQEYDRTTPYLGKVGALPDSSKLWPYDSLQIATGMWPQYQIGAYPYCFPLPKYDSTTMKMGQSPGTHWYHAHKHGSTALNVANALHGVFIITGAYDSSLKAFYGSTFRERTMMIQQIGTAPFPLTNPLTTGPGSVARPLLSINGRLNPVVSMRPGEVQMWRVVNGAFRDGVQFMAFVPSSATTCVGAAPSSSLQWRQIAEDGVQINVSAYNTFGAINKVFNLAPANRT